MENNPFDPAPILFDSSKEVEDVLSELANNFKRTEQKVCEVQDSLNITPVASLNQLRYAGYHICQIIGSDKTSLYGNPITLDHSHLLSAYKHCLRAYYDALDHACVIIGDAFRAVEEKYNDLLVHIEEHFPDYHKWRVEINAISKLRSLAEENSLYERAKNKNKREEYYALLDEKIKSVLHIYEHIPLMADKLSLLVQQSEQERRKYENDLKQSQSDTLRAKRNFQVAVVSLVIMVLTLIVAVAVPMFDDEIKQLGAKWKGNGKTEAAVIGK